MVSKAPLSDFWAIYFKITVSFYHTYPIVSNVSFLNREMVFPSGTRFLKLSMVDID